MLKCWGLYTDILSDYLGRRCFLCKFCISSKVISFAPMADVPQILKFLSAASLCSVQSSAYLLLPLSLRGLVFPRPRMLESEFLIFLIFLLF